MKSNPIIAKEVNYDFKKSNRLIQTLKVMENTDISFSPYLYSQKLLEERIEEDERRHDQKITKLKNEEPEMYSKYLKMQEEINNSLLIKDTLQDMQKSADKQTQLNKKEEKSILELLNSCNNDEISKYDLLIYLTWSYPSRENYMRYWNIIINNHSPNLQKSLNKPS